MYTNFVFLYRFLFELSCKNTHTHKHGHTHTHTHRDSNEYPIVAFSKNATIKIRVIPHGKVLGQELSVKVLWSLRSRVTHFWYK